jgi:hypothetical protein
VPKEKVEARQRLLNNSPFSLSFPIRHILHNLHKLYCPVSFLQRNVYVVLTWNRDPNGKRHVGTPPGGHRPQGSYPQAAEKQKAIFSHQHEKKKKGCDLPE